MDKINEVNNILNKYGVNMKLKKVGESRSSVDMDMVAMALGSGDIEGFIEDNDMSLNTVNTIYAMDKAIYNRQIEVTFADYDEDVDKGKWKYAYVTKTTDVVDIVGADRIIILSNKPISKFNEGKGADLQKHGKQVADQIAKLRAKIKGTPKEKTHKIVVEGNKAVLVKKSKEELKANKETSKKMKGKKGKKITNSAKKKAEKTRKKTKKNENVSREGELKPFNESKQLNLIKVLHNRRLDPTKNSDGSYSFYLDELNMSESIDVMKDYFKPYGLIEEIETNGQLILIFKNINKDLYFDFEEVGHGTKVNTYFGEEYDMSGFNENVLVTGGLKSFNESFDNIEKSLSRLSADQQFEIANELYMKLGGDPLLEWNRIKDSVDDEEVKDHIIGLVTGLSEISQSDLDMAIDRTIKSYNESITPENKIKFNEAKQLSNKEQMFVEFNDIKMGDRRSRFFEGKVLDFGKKYGFNIDKTKIDESINDIGAIILSKFDETLTNDEIVSIFTDNGVAIDRSNIASVSQVEGEYKVKLTNDNEYMVTQGLLRPINEANGLVEKHGEILANKIVETKRQLRESGDHKTKMVIVKDGKVVVKDKSDKQIVSELKRNIASKSKKKIDEMKKINESKTKRINEVVEQGGYEKYNEQYNGLVLPSGDQDLGTDRGLMSDFISDSKEISVGNMMNEMDELELGALDNSELLEHMNGLMEEEEIYDAYLDDDDDGLDDYEEQLKQLYNEANTSESDILNNGADKLGDYLAGKVKVTREIKAFNESKKNPKNGSNKADAFISRLSGMRW